MLLDHNLAGLPTDRYWTNYRRDVVASPKVVVAVNKFPSLKTFLGDVHSSKLRSPSHVKVVQLFFRAVLVFNRAVDKAVPNYS